MRFLRVSSRSWIGVNSALGIHLRKRFFGGNLRCYHTTQMSENDTYEQPGGNTVLLEIENRIAWVTLNRPHKRNAISPELMQEMLQVLDFVESGIRRKRNSEGIGISRRDPHVAQSPEVWAPLA